MGITELDLNNVTNILNVCHSIKEHNKRLRKEAMDSSCNLLVVGRKMDIVPDIWIEIRVKPGLYSLGEISERGELAGVYDATGGMYRLKKLIDRKYIQHMILVVQPQEFVLTQSEYPFCKLGDFN